MSKVGETRETPIAIPSGWKMVKVTRKKGVTAGKVDTYITSPGGKLLRSQKALAEYLLKKKLPYSAEELYSSLLKNNKSPVGDKTLNTSLSQQTSSDSSLNSLNTSDDSLSILHTTDTRLQYNIVLEDNQTPTDGKHKILETLLEPNWLTDDTINIYFDLLNLKVANSSTYLMSPVVTAAIKNLEDFFDLLLPLKLEERQYVLLPVNDSPKLQKLGGNGSHWSLLLVDMSSKVFYHIDSLKDYNYNHAQTICEKFHSFFNFPAQPTLVKIESPQQTNGYDCGIHMLLSTDSIVHSLLENSSVVTADKIKQILHYPTEGDILTKRGQLAVLFHKARYTQVSKDTMKQLLYYKKPVVNADCVTKQQNTELLQTHEAMLETVGKSREETFGKTKEWIKYFPKKKYGRNNSNIHTKHFTIPTINKYGLLQREEKKEEVNKFNNFERSLRNPQLKKANSKIFQPKHTPIFRKEIKMSVFSDSQGRDICMYLDQINNSELNTSAVVMPGAPLLHVVDTALQLQATKHSSDVIVLLGGTNDTVDGDFSPIYKDLERNLAVLDKQTPVLLSTIPERHDADILDPVHNKICLLNNYLKEVAARLKQTKIIDLQNLKRYHFHKPGFHLNRNGKKKFAYLVTHTLEKIFNEPSKHSDLILKNNKIKIIERNMKDVIHDCKNDVDTAFAHCVSKDFFMGAGVAVTMREEFGRPSASNYIGKHLTFQKTEYGASVYSLVTKPKYFMKPRVCDYDLAFDELVDDFKKKGFKKLICSPMGCVRDRINPYIFASHIVDFQTVTGAVVEVVSYNQNSEKELLGNGLPHCDFQQRLIHNILTHQLRRTSNSSMQLTELLTETPYQPASPSASLSLPNEQRSSCASTPQKSLKQVPLVVPGDLTFSEVLKQKCSEGDMRRGSAGSWRSDLYTNGQSPVLNLNSQSQQNTPVK